MIVFVHGIFGDAEDTWTYAPTKIYWPKLLLSDPAFNDSDVYVASYDSPYFGNAMNIGEVAKNLKNRLVNDEVFLKHREVVFVCHSLSGLVVQQLLLMYREYAQQVPFIYFFSTPESGAQIATLGGLFSSDPLLKEMFSGDENGYLQGLEDNWRAAHFKIHRLCAYEKKKFKGVLVVDRLSGTRNCDEPALPINENHLGIVKPDGTNHDSYLALRNAVKNYAITPAASPPKHKKSVPSPRLDSHAEWKKLVEDALYLSSNIGALPQQLQDKIHDDQRRSPPRAAMSKEEFDNFIAKADWNDFLGEYLDQYESPAVEVKEKILKILPIGTRSSFIDLLYQNPLNPSGFSMVSEDLAKLAADLNRRIAEGSLSAQLQQPPSVGGGQFPSTSLETIQTLTAESRLTFDLDPDATLPPPEIPFVPIGPDSNAHLRGDAGDEELTFVSPIVFQRQPGGKVVAINTFSLVVTSALRGRPVSAVSNFHQLIIPAVVVGASSLRRMALYEVTMTLNGKQIWYYSYQLNGADYKSGPTFTIPFHVKH